MNKLTEVPMRADALLKSKFYIWATDCGEKKVVWLNEDGDGLQEFSGRHGFDERYFEHNLKGILYGPFEITGDDPTFAY